MLQPPIFSKVGVFLLVFFESKNIEVEQKTQTKIRKNKGRRKGFEIKNKTGNPKND